MTNFGGPDLYYRHSGRFTAGGLLLGLVGGSVASIVLAIPYAYITLWVPLIYINGLTVLAYGAAVGWITGYLLQRGKVRSVPLALTVGFLVALAALYGAWVFWFSALGQKSGRVGFLQAFYAVLRPRIFLEVMEAIYLEGTWKLNRSSGSVKGVMLGIVWLIEAGAILSTALYFVRQFVNKLPFCEHCDRWGISKPLVKVALIDPDELRQRMEAHDFAFLQTLGPGAPRSWCEVSLEGCPDCDTTQTLCLNSTSITLNSKGEEKRTTERVVHRLRLTPEQVVEVAALAATIEAGPPAAGASAPPAEAPAAALEKPAQG